MGRIRFGIGLLALSTCLVASSVEAQTQWTAAFFFEGRGARMGENAVGTVARNHVMVIPGSEVREATRRLEADVETPEGRAAVAADRTATLIVVGTMRGRGRGARVSIEVQDAEGQRISEAAGRIPRSRPERERFSNVIGAAFTRAAEELDNRARAAREQELAADTREVVSVDDERPDGGDDDDGPAAERTKPYIVGLVGIGGRGRNATVDLASGRRRNYTIGMYPELTIYAEGRPLAGMGAPLDGIYAAVQVGFALSLQTEDPMTGASYSTSAWRLDILAGYLHDLGPLEIGANIGFSDDAFQIDTNTIFPGVEYPSLRIGLAGRIPFMKLIGSTPLIERLFRLDIDAGIRIVFGTGALASMFAASAGAFGYDIIASLTGSLDIGLTYALRFGYIGYGLSFSGMSPTAETGTGGRDGGIVLTLGVGWQI